MMNKRQRQFRLLLSDISERRKTLSRTDWPIVLSWTCGCRERFLRALRRQLLRPTRASFGIWD